MVSPKRRRDATPSTTTFWLPDPEDLNRLISLLEICGYTDQWMAEEEASSNIESGTVFEVTVRRCNLEKKDSWLDEAPAHANQPEPAWQA